MDVKESKVYKEKLARKILDLSIDSLTIYLPYFNRALLKMPISFYEPMLIEEDIIGGFATNTKEIICDPDLVIKLFEENNVIISRYVLHTVLHCLYKHPFRYKMLDRQLWDFACDVAIEAAIISLEISDLSQDKDSEKETIISFIKKKVGKISAEAIYTHMQADKEDMEAWLAYEELFKCDKHKIWGDRTLEFYEGLFLFSCEENEINQSGNEWSKIFRDVQKDKDLIEEGFGISPSSVEDYVGKVGGDDYDYTEFLTKFAKMKEEIKLNPDEFDYIYYTYGFELYDNMPLIEPLEYRESLKIYDFIIAIDTSGSCRGRTVKNFLKRTYSILKGTELFGEKMNVHIIQCDNQIQEDTLIISDEAFERYISNVTVKGSGGTDFRPVFEHIEKLKKAGAFTDLRGLIYFSDALGIFPEKEPDYKTAFVIMPQTDELPTLPSWVIGRVVSRSDLDDE